jgi:diguanylate cyclase (GGDEF)-like protein
MGEKQKRMGTALLIVFLGVLMFIQVVRVNVFENSLIAREGVINIGEQNIEKGSLYRIEGTWQSDEDSKEYAEEENDFSRTYRLRIVGYERNPFAIMLSDFSPSYRVWINGRLMSDDDGMPENGEDFHARFSHEILDINSGMYAERHGIYELEMVIETVETGNMGPDFNRLILGDRGTLEKSGNTMIGLNLFAIGSYLILFLFSFFLYYGGKRESYLLFFSLTNLVSFFKSMLNSHPVLANGMMEISYTLLKRMDFTTSVLNVLLIFLLYDRLYPGLIGNRLNRSVVAINLLMVISIFVSGYETATQMYMIIYIGIYFAMSALCLYINLRAIWQGRKNAIILFAGVVIYIGSVILAIFMTRGIVPRGLIGLYVNPAQYGSLVFVVLFSMVIAVNYGKRFKEAGRLSAELAYVNENLERTIGEKTSELRLLNEKLRVQAETDGLTGILNHNAIFKMLQNEIDRVVRYGDDLSVLMVDVDHFKQVNSEYGHLEGDRVLFELSSVLRNVLRRIDNVGRYGGEEFLIVLPKTSLTGAGEIAERLRKTVEEAEVGLVSRNITVSIGMSTFGEGDGVMDLVERADTRLYESKRLGRNRVS